MSILQRIRDVLLPRLCPVDAGHGDLRTGADGRRWCPACGYVENPCDCD